MSSMRKICFLCQKTIILPSSGVSKHHSQSQYSVMLFDILEMSHLKDNTFKYEQIDYCNLCVSKILNIRDKLEELERKEEEILHEKYMIELQLKQNCRNYQENFNYNLVHETYPINFFREAMINELKSNTIQSMLAKIQKKIVGRKLSRQQQRCCNNIKIMKEVKIPKMFEFKNNIDWTYNMSIDSHVEDGRNNFNLSVEKLPNIQGPSKLPLSFIAPISQQPSIHNNSTDIGIHVISSDKITSLPYVDKVDEDDSLTSCLYDVTEMKFDNHVSDIQHEDFLNQIIKPSFNEHEEPLTTGPFDGNHEFKFEPAVSEKPHHTLDTDPFEGLALASSDFELQNNIIIDKIILDVDMTDTGINISEHPTRRDEANSSQMLLQDCDGSIMENRFICGICGVSFDEYNLLEKHDKLHLNNQVNTMENANKKKVDIFKKKKHKNIQKLSPCDKPKKCNECGKVLLSRRTLNYHILHVHKGQSNVQCTLCNYGCRTASILKTHMARSHCEERNFQCPMCTKTFKTNVDLNSHITTHSGHKRYNCKLCLIRFGSWRTYRKHREEVHSVVYDKIYV